jgi:hypothetical protein
MLLREGFSISVSLFSSCAGTTLLLLWGHVHMWSRLHTTVLGKVYMIDLTVVEVLDVDCFPLDDQIINMPSVLVLPLTG